MPMATCTLSYLEDSELSGFLTRSSTVTDPAENRLDILRREFVRKVEDWPSAQIIGQMKYWLWLGSLSVSGETQWNDEMSQPSAYKELVAWVDSWEGVESIISQIRFSQLVRHGERISNRLSDLRRSIREEEGKHADISADSIRAFFSFLKLCSNIRYPDITLAPDGDIYARWKGDNGSLFSVEFLPNSRVGYVVFAPTPRHSGELSRNSGIDFVDTVFDRINAAFGISAWILE